MTAQKMTDGNRQGGSARVLILGAGYAGQMAALRLRGSQAKVTVVDGSEYFVERIRLHQAATNQALPRHAMSSLLPKTSTFLRARVEHIDKMRREVRVLSARGPQRLEYDYLIYALGSVTDRTVVPGLQEHAWILDGERNCAKLSDRLAQLALELGTVNIVGGALTGIELACELAEGRPGLKVRLISAHQVGGFLSKKGQQHVLKTLKELGVEVLPQAAVAEVSASVIHLKDGRELAGQLHIWCAGFRASEVAKTSALPVNGEGRVKVNTALQVVDHPEIIAVGDGAVIDEELLTPLKMSCAVAMPMGAHGGTNLKRLIMGEPLKPFSFAYALMGVSLGRRQALVERLLPGGEAQNMAFTGRFAVWLKEFICRYTLRMVRWERRLNLPLYHWPQAKRLP